MAGKNPVDGESFLQGSAGKTLVEFLEVAITSVVFLRGIYPSGGFERTRYRNVVVHKARHPQLRHYIQSSVASLLPFIQKGLVDRLAVIFSGPDNFPVERFIFKLDTNPISTTKVEEVDLESSMKQFLIKMSASEPLTKALPKDCRWEITAYFRSIPETGTSKDAGSWAPTRTKPWQQLPFIIPIKSMCNGPVNLQLYVEHVN